LAVAREKKGKEYAMSTNGTNGANGNGNGSKRNSLSYWTTDPRWSGITRPYSYSDVLRLRGSIQI
jgi:hypothetical protein